LARFALSELGEAAAWGAIVGLSLLGGAVVATVARLPERAAAALSAAGGGILLTAVAFELVPEADAAAGPALTAGGLLAGTLVFVGADAWLSRDAAAGSMRRARHAAAAGRPMAMPRSPEEVRGESLALGLFLDGVPESVALGLTVAMGEIGVALLAGIVAGNLIEAYGAAQPLLAGGRSRRFALGLLGAIAAALAAATALGGSLLAEAGPALTGTAQAFAAGAVLAVVTVTIVPHAFEQVSRLVASATVAGYAAAYLLGS
jgi:ZIP family zinc transporter